MAQYGKFLDTYDPNKECVYSLVDDFFDHPVMTKTKNHDSNSIYMCKIHSLLSVENRYLIAITNRDTFPLGYKIPLKEVIWVSFQTRNLQETYKGMIPHKYLVKKGVEYQKRISLIRRDGQASYYDVDLLPIMVTLLHGKGSGYAYQQQGILLSALETYSTILTFK